MPVNHELKWRIVKFFETQEDAAEALGIRLDLLNRYINGRRQPTREHRLRLARALHTTEERLFGDEERVSA